MLVTALQSQKRDSSRLNMFIDGQFYCGVSVKIVADFAIYQGKELTQEMLDEILFAELKSRFFDRAVSYLVRSPKTQFQIKRYLKDLAFKKKGKWFDDLSKESFEKIEGEIIGKLLEYEYIDDRRFAQLFIESRIKNKPRGRNILYGELLAKGVPKDIVEETLDELLSDEYGILVSTYRKKFRDEKITMEDRKKIDFLRRKGFNWDLIEKFINDESSK